MNVHADTLDNLPDLLKFALAKLRVARFLNPDHESPVGTWHTFCDICYEQRRFDYLCDKLSRRH